MALLNTNIGPERVQVFDQPIGTVQVAGVPTSVTAFLISSGLAGAPVNVPNSVTNMADFEALFGNADSIADDGYYAVEGYFNNAGNGNTAIIVNVGQGTAEVSTITTVADVSDSLRGKYFRINSAYDRKQYYVWYRTNTLGTDPSASNPGRIGVRVDIATNATAAQVATATATALDGLADFAASAALAVVTVTNSMGGPATDAADGSGGGATTFTIATMTQGARPSANSYIGDASAGSGLRALDTQDTLGLVAIPGLPLSTAYLVHPSLIDYTETVRAEFGATLSTSFSLLAPPKEITKANKDVEVLASTAITVVSSLVITLGTADLSAVTPGMVVKKAGVVVAKITAVSGSTITVDTAAALAVSDNITINIPSAITYKDYVINNPSRVAGWYFNNLIVNNQQSNAADGSLVTIDPTGHVAGVMARIDANTAIGGVSHAPAGTSFASITGIQGLSLILSERLDAAPLRLAFINRITSFPGLGNIIFGGYTAGGSSVTADEQLIQVMRALQFIKGSLERGLRGFLWENFSPATQEKIANAITSFLRNNIYLFPSGLPENQQFKVISVTPTQDELDQGLLRVRIQVRPNKAVRFIEIALEFPLPVA
jgi:hypothetical protein